MKKTYYWILKIILLCIIFYNLGYLVINIFKSDSNIIYIENEDIKAELIEMIYSKKKINIPMEEILIKKVVLEECFPNGGYNIGVYYTNKDNIEDLVVIFETDRHNGDTPIADYLFENGKKDLTLKNKYSIIKVITIVLIIIFILMIILNRYVKRK